MHPVRAYLLCCALASLSGCGTLTGLLGEDVNADIDRNAKRFADAYCKQPLSVREVDSRPRVNRAIAPHKARMDCYCDPANPCPTTAPASGASESGPAGPAVPGS